MNRLDSELTVVLALSILEQARHEAQKGPVPRTNALRLALAYLHERAGGDRAPFDEFWRTCGDPVADAHSETMSNIRRSATLTPAIHRIWRALGIPPDLELVEQLGKAQALEQRTLAGTSRAEPVVP
ncbi:hypothetical protein M9978_02255 [Sphingomonas sp. MG17]|uniref:Uncharacterized protein n=1 Tax=Sphingomonas tagetis TaxID=2949092 RepID=A0A9X2KN31_9SPHN|nr:hypothetical protein [Sphingomonas tagetis]MCP3729238.1 hypothetical protein [Sphingomonas tagetis]